MLKNSADLKEKQENVKFQRDSLQLELYKKQLTDARITKVKR
jgi:hypothetical protein